MCSTDELRDLINGNTRLLESHITKTDDRFNSIMDTVTRIAHHSETIDNKLIGHVEWEEGYHVQEQAKYKRLEEKLDKIADQNEDLLEFTVRIKFLGWLGEKLKTIFLWIIALGGAGAITFEIIDYVKKLK